MKKKLYKFMNWPVIEAVTYHEEAHPFDVLGPKSVTGGTLFQAFYQDAVQMNLCIDDRDKKVIPMEMADEMGYFAQIVPGKITSDYEYEVIRSDGSSITYKDPYRFSHQFIQDKDRDAFNGGTQYKSYEMLGAFICHAERVKGVRFALWAPTALSVCILGSFNDFTSGIHMMHRDDKSGIYEMFIPQISVDECYCYEIKTRNGSTVIKPDPFSKEIRFIDGKAYSVICEDSFEFTDDDFIKDCNDHKRDRLSICEIDLESLKTSDLYSTLDVKSTAERIVKHVKDFGYDYVKFLPFTETLSDDPSCDATAFFYAISNRLFEHEDLKELVNTLHMNGIGVLFDFGCTCFSPAIDSLNCFDGTCLYEHLDSRQSYHPGKAALNFNYSRPEVTSFLISNALYYIEQYHFDGLYINGTSSMLYLDYHKNEGEWVPNLYGGNENLDGIEFLKHMNSVLKKKHRDIILIAEEDAAFRGVTTPVSEDGLGFDLKLNNGFSDDYLSYISYDPYFRAHHHNELTFSMVYQYSENFICGFPHDYSVPGTGAFIDNMPGEDDERLANLRLSYAYLYMHPGKKMLMMGPDFGSEYVLGNNYRLDFGLLRKNAHKGLRALIRELNKLYSSNKALYELDESSDGFEWINCISSNECTLSFLRKGSNDKDTFLVVCNFAGVIRQISVGTSLPGKYKELINTDDKVFGGSNITNTRTKVVSEKEADGRPYSIEVKLAPLSAAIFKYVPFTEQEKYKIEKKKEALIADSNAAKYKEEARIAQLEYDEAKAIMEEALERMNDAEKRVKKALDNEKKELSKAKKALEEAK